VDNANIINAMAEQLSTMFWDFRCYYMHNGGNSINFDFDFFRLARNSEIVFGGEYTKAAGSLFSFKNNDLNSNLQSRTIEEHEFKTIIMAFFFLRKEFIKIKRGDITITNPGFYLDLLVTLGESRGRIDMLEALKREVIWNQSSDHRVLAEGRIFTIPLGGAIEKALKTVRRFQRAKKRGPDDFTKHLLSMFRDFHKDKGRYPSNKDVISLLEQAAGQGFIHSVDEEIEWGESGTTKINTLQNRLVEVRKILRKKIMVSGKP